MAGDLTGPPGGRRREAPADVTDELPTRSISPMRPEYRTPCPYPVSTAEMHDTRCRPELSREGNDNFPHKEPDIQGLQMTTMLRRNDNFTESLHVCSCRNPAEMKPTGYFAGY